MTNFRKSVAAPAIVGAGAPTPKKGLVTVIYAEDVLNYPGRDANGVLMLGNLVLKAGAKMYTLYETPSSQKAAHETEGDEDLEGFVKTFEGFSPGDSLELNEFAQNSLGQGFIIIYGIGCSQSQGKMLGDPCNPMKVKAGFVDDKDGRKHTFVFSQTYKDRFLAGFYNGAITYAENYVAATAALDLLVANGPVYQLPSLAVTAPVTAASIDLAHNTIVSLIGGGGDAPATLDSGIQGGVTVILKDDTTWTGLELAVINLLVYKAGAITYLIEQSRS